MTAQMDVERTEEPKQTRFKLAYGTLLTSLLVIWTAWFYWMLGSSQDKSFAVKITLWVIGTVGMAVSIVFMWRAYDRNNDRQLCKIFGVAFLVLNLVGFGVFTAIAFATQRYEGDHEEHKRWRDFEPTMWMLGFGLVASVLCCCTCVALAVFPKPLPAPHGFREVPPSPV